MQRMYKTFVVSAALVVIYFLSGAPVCAQNIVRNYTPPAWLAEDIQWSRDVTPHNGIDDMIDMSKDSLFDIVVNYRRCVEDTDLDLLEDLSPSSHVQYRLKFITSVCVGGVTLADIDSIISLSEVAFIEQQYDFEPLLDVSVPNIKAASGFYSPNTAEDAYPTIDGSGLNIIIMDTGVDDDHDAFNNTTFIGGYDENTHTFTNPDDTHGHGTHVASIALGQATANTSRGVAPGAGLIDVKCIPGTFASVTHALEMVYTNWGNWGATGLRGHILNMSFGGGPPADGMEAFNELVDLSSYFGILAVSAAGNSYPMIGFSSPAAATRAITVAASNDHNNQDRDASTISTFSNQGPRMDDGDSDIIDELKPEVTAPGTGIVAAQHNTVNGAVSKSGTSMAAPHVAGLAALIMQANPGYNTFSIKEMIIRAAEAKGAPSNPGVDPTWNDRWGWGLVDAYNSLYINDLTDVTFPNYPWSVSGSVDCPDIEIYPEPQAGYPSNFIVDIENRGPGYANDARIHFGAYQFSATIPAFQDIGTRIVDLPVGTTPVTFVWTPSFVGHVCLTVNIAYGPDIDFTNNWAQENRTVITSPVQVQVQNTATETLDNVILSYDYDFDSTTWQVMFNPDSIIPLAADDCPELVDIHVFPPPDAITGEEKTVNVYAYVNEDFLGGVALDKHIIAPPIFDSISEAQNLTFHFFKDGQYWQEPWEYIYWVGDYDVYNCDYHTGELNFREEHPELEGFPVKCGFYRQSGPDGWRQTIFYHGGVSDVMVLEPLLPPLLAEPRRIPDIAPGWPGDFDTIFTAVNMDEYLLSNPLGFKDGNWAAGQTLDDIDIFVKGGVVEGLGGIYWATSEFVVDKSSPSGFRPEGGDDSYLDSETYDGSLIIIAEHYGGIETGAFCCEIAGDADNNQVVNLLDITYLINYLYKSGPEPPCYHEGNADGSGDINILDVTHLISYLYKGGDTPICPIM